MPPLRVHSPMSLEMLCFCEVMNHIHKELQVCGFLQRFERTSLILRRRDINAGALQSEVANYLSKLPPLLSENVRQQITNKLMKGAFDAPMIDCNAEIYHGQNITIAMLEVVLNHEISTIEFSNSSQVTGVGSFSRIWPLILKCSGLKRLVLLPDLFALDHKKVPTFTTPFLTELTLNCPFLTELVLKNIITDSNPLQAIGQNCHLLEKLDISGSRKVTNLSILHLCIKPGLDGTGVLPNNKFPDGTETEKLTPLCQTLVELILTNTGVRAKGIGFLLRAMPQLTSLGDLAYTAAGLKGIYTLVKAKRCRALKLKHVFYRGPSNIKLKILASCCPNLESLYLGSKAERRIPTSQRLNATSFAKLTYLALENIHSDDIAVGLQYTSNLLGLTIDCNNLDVSLISKLCPKLQELRMNREPARQMRHLDPAQRCFQELQQLICYSPVSCDVASMFFTNALKLRQVEIVRIRDASDTLFMSWVMKNPFVHLECLVIRYIELTRVSVDWLISNCPNLTKLGELGGWDIRVYGLLILFHFQPCKRQLPKRQGSNYLPVCRACHSTKSWECRRINDMCVARNYDLKLLIYPVASHDVYDIFDDQSDISISSLSA